MSYEYKEEILLDIGPEPNCNYESESNRYYDKIEELDRVYAQAAKADEYEAKAKAFDQTKETLKEDVEKLEKLEKDFPLSCQDDLEKLNNILVLMTRYESGEPYVKK